MSLYQRGLEKTQIASSSKKGLFSLEKEKSSASLKTDIDKFYHLVEISAQGIALLQVLEILDVSAAQVEEWAKILEKQGLLRTSYTPTGGAMYFVQGKNNSEKTLSPFYLLRSRGVLFLLSLLLFFLLALLFFLFFTFGGFS